MNHKIYIKRSGAVGHHTLTGMDLLPTLTPNKGTMLSFLRGKKIIRKYNGAVISWGAIFSKKPFIDAEVVCYTDTISEDILKKIGVKAKHKSHNWEKVMVKTKGTPTWIEVNVI